MSGEHARVPAVDREAHLQRAVVRILDRGLSVVGTGFLVAPDLVATCAHVVNQALRENGKHVPPAGQEITIDLASGTPDDLVFATVEGAFFRDEDAEDIALLRLKHTLSSGVAPLALAASGGSYRRELRGFGFPKVGRNGLWMTATVVGPLDDRRAGRRLQLSSRNILPGCSGGPLCDERGRVVCVAVSILDRSETAFAIAAEVLALVCPELSVEEGRPSAWHVPFLRNTSFVGRKDDLTRLHTLLQTGETVGVRPAALTGMGGIGKTQLAVEYAFRYADTYPGGVYWVNAAGDDWRPALATLAIELDLNARDAPGAERQSRLIAALARYLRDRPDALVIFDNVDQPAALRSNRRAGLVPMSLGCHLLFTTRRRRDADGHFACIEVSVLPPDAALELLLSSPERKLLWEKRDALENTSDVAAGRDICRALGALPLALVLAAAFLGRNPKVTLAGYRSRIAKHGALATIDKNQVTSDELATQHGAAMEATLTLQWEALDSEDARLTLRAAALLDEAAEISRARLSLLTELAAMAEEGFTAPMDEALRELAGLSLVESLEANEAVQIHPLIREFARRRIEVRHVFEAECAERLGEALWDMGRLHDEVAARGIDAVLEDLRIGSKLAGTSGQARFETLILPLDRESHVLRRWVCANEPGFFLQQLRNRCFEIGIEDVRTRAEGKLDEQGWPWLRTRIRVSRESDALVRTFEGHSSSVTGVAVTADDRFAVSSSTDGTLKLWNLATGVVVRTLRANTDIPHCIAVTSDGRFVVSAGEGYTLKVWDLATGQLVRTLEGHTFIVNGIAVTKDGRFAVSASSDRTLKVWDLATGRVVWTLEGHSFAVNGVAVTPDGCFAVSASEDDTLKVWDLSTGQMVRTFEPGTGSVRCVTVTADGRFAVSTNVFLKFEIWDLATGQMVRVLDADHSYALGAAVSSDGRVAVSYSVIGTALKVWDLATGQAVRTLEGHSAMVYCAAVTSDGRFAISASSDNTLKVWALGTGQVLHPVEKRTSPVTDVAVTANSRFAVSRSYDGEVQRWDLDSGEAFRINKKHYYLVTGVATSPNGCIAVFPSSPDDVPQKWDLDTDRVVPSYDRHHPFVRGIALWGDARFAAFPFHDQRLQVWDFVTREVVRTLKGHSNDVNCGVVTSDGRFAISASKDKTLKVWDLATGTMVRTLKGHVHCVTSVAVTSDDRFAISASADKTLKVWALGTGQLVHTLKGHAAAVMAVAVTADGRFAVSASEDATLKVWDLATMQSLATVKNNARWCCCTITPDGKTILAGGFDGPLHILDWIEPKRPAALVECCRASKSGNPKPRTRAAADETAVPVPFNASAAVPALSKAPERTSLPRAMLRRIQAAGVRAGFGKDARHALFHGIATALVATFPEAFPPTIQLRSDLTELNKLGRLPDGSVPLATWLLNARALVGSGDEADVFREALAAISM